MKEYVDLEGLKLFLELFKEAMANNGPLQEEDINENIEESNT